MSLATLNRGPNFPVVNAGSQAAPTAGTAVATIASGSLPVGRYQVHVLCRGSGATDEPVRGNMELRAGAVVLQKGLHSANAPAGEFSHTVDLDGSTALTVNATANATASTTYQAMILARKL